MRKYVFIVHQMQKDDNSLHCVSRVFSSLDSAEKYRHEMFDKDSKFFGYIDMVRLYE